MRLTNNTDWKDRFRNEYHELDTRIEKLQNMLEKYDDGTLIFEPKSPYQLLYEQLVYMKLYKSVLEKRAEIEGIEL